MKKFARNIAVFLVPVFIGIILLFTVPVNKKFSYQFVKGECSNIASWIYYRAFENQKSIDIAFSGASHFACGIMDELIENELNSNSDYPITVANLGYCRGGRDVQYIMLKDILKHKKPKILFIEIAEDEPRKSHPVFPFLAESNDLFGSFVFFNQRYFKSLWNGLIVRFEFFKFKLMRETYFTPDNTSNFGYLHSDQLANPDEMESNKRAWQNKLNRPKPELIKTIERNYSKHYFTKIVQLANQHKCRVLFFYLPESGSNLKVPLNMKFYETLAPVISLPDTIINNPANWKDPMHFNDTGAEKTSLFIVPVIEKELAKIDNVAKN
ncbi:MAG: hypothetical protein AB7S72_08015 [Draconibacterium sp.]